MVPEPQVFEQELQDPQVFQVQSTENHCQFSSPIKNVNSEFVRMFVLDVIFTWAANICIAYPTFKFIPFAISTTIGNPCQQEPCSILVATTAGLGAVVRGVPVAPYTPFAIDC